jgi:peptidoglycan/xylan/chitin deacetylase (PgdA/CDA1 family)
MGNPMRRTALLLIGLALILLTIPYVQGTISFVPGNRVTVIRIDDIQDYPDSPGWDYAEKTVLQYQMSANLPTLLAVIASRFGNDANLTAEIKSGLSSGVFYVGEHGWHHDNFTNMSLGDQATQMHYAKARIQTVLGFQTLAFIPPYNLYTSTTIEAMKKEGLTLISSATYTGDIPRMEGGIMYLPQTVTTANVDNQSDIWDPVTLDSITEQITDSWSNFGIAVVVFHPRQFVDQSGAWSNDRWQIYLNMIAWLKNNNADIVKVDPPSPPIVSSYNYNPLLISVVIFSGLTSSLLIAFNLSSKRSKKEKISVKEETNVQSQ